MTKYILSLFPNLEEEKAVDEKLSELGTHLITPEIVQAVATIEAM